jgi:hypothetical protein
MVPVSQPHLVQVRSFDNPSTLRLVSLSNRRAGLRTIPSALITVATSGKDYLLVCSTDFRPATPRSIQHPRWYRALTIAENGRTESTRRREKCCGLIPHSDSVLSASRDPDSLNPAWMPTSPVHSLWRVFTFLTMKVYHLRIELSKRKRSSLSYRWGVIFSSSLALGM